MQSLITLLLCYNYIGSSGQTSFVSCSDSTHSWGRGSRVRGWGLGMTLDHIIDTNADKSYTLCQSLYNWKLFKQSPAPTTDAMLSPVRTSHLWLWLDLLHIELWDQQQVELIMSILCSKHMPRIWLWLIFSIFKSMTRQTTLLYLASRKAAKQNHFGHCHALFF